MLGSMAICPDGFFDANAGATKVLIPLGSLQYTDGLKFSTFKLYRYGIYSLVHMYFQESFNSTTVSCTYRVPLNALDPGMLRKLTSDMCAIAVWAAGPAGLLAC